MLNPLMLNLFMNEENVVYITMEYYPVTKENIQKRYNLYHWIFIASLALRGEIQKENLKDGTGPKDQMGREKRRGPETEVWVSPV